MITVATLALGACLAVGAASDQVVAGDLAAGAPEWAAIPAETPLALAPAPGVQRVFRLPELRRLALRWNLTPPERELCVTRPVAVPDPALLLAAMRAQLPAAQIEILEYSQQPAPQGDLEFPLSGLRQSPGGAWWSGAVRYAGQRRFALWARVKVEVPVARVVATATLQPGRPIDAALLRLESREEFPSTGYLATIEETAGKVPRRSIAAGTPLRTQWLEPARVIVPGDMVQVEIVSGGARLVLDGVAATAGAVGDSILVLNPDSKKQFRARVIAAGKVLVTRGNL
ncbi:MAG TPA: flagellar basal body P-ring formation chaperone FlgA [Candidatus Solibacter sp.]|jgi:flagella basal body P-ring formation protein FlgA